MLLRAGSFNVDYFHLGVPFLALKGTINFVFPAGFAGVPHYVPSLPIPIPNAGHLPTVYLFLKPFVRPDCQLRPALYLPQCLRIPAVRDYSPLLYRLGLHPASVRLDAFPSPVLLCGRCDEHAIDINRVCAVLQR